MRLHRDHKVEMISKVPLFAKCSKKDLRKIAAIADEIDLRTGKVLTRQGAPGREFFVLLEGAVDVVRDDKTVNKLGAGDFFGEVALVSKKPRNATITTTASARALVITDRNFRQLLHDNPGISVKVLEAVAVRAEMPD
jgi:CRP-like cAMP-binding protein